MLLLTAINLFPLAVPGNGAVAEAVLLLTAIAVFLVPPVAEAVLPFTATATLWPGSEIAVLVVPFCTLWVPLTETDTSAPPVSVDGWADAAPASGTEIAPAATAATVSFLIMFLSLCCRCPRQPSRLSLPRRTRRLFDDRLLRTVSVFTSATSARPLAYANRRIGHAHALEVMRRPPQRRRATP